MLNIFVCEETVTAKIRIVNLFVSIECEKFKTHSYLKLKCNIRHHTMETIRGTYLT